MSENTVNQRISEMVNFFAKGNKSAFAKTVGISNQSLGEIVGGRQNAPSFVALQKIALAYPSISLNWLVLGEGLMFELTDEDKASKLEQFADEVEDKMAEMISAGELPASFASLSPSGLWQLRTEEEVARVELADAIEQHQRLKAAQYKRTQANEKESAADKKMLSQAADNEALAEANYVEATRSRIRTERALLGFNTSSSTAVYKLGEEVDSDALYGGRLADRLGISYESAEKLVKSGKIRATYIDGEGYRITEQAVRTFLGEL